MNSLILRSVAGALVPLQLVFSLFLLLRGHNEPGGGFSAGLVVGAAIALHALAFTPRLTRRLLRVEPLSIAGVGLLVALVSGVFGLLAGGAYMEGQWLELELAGTHWDLGTPLLFDVGVYLLVIGTGAAVLLTLMED